MKTTHSFLLNTRRYKPCKGDGKQSCIKKNRSAFYGPLSCSILLGAYFSGKNILRLLGTKLWNWVCIAMVIKVTAIMRTIPYCNFPQSFLPDSSHGIRTHISILDNLVQDQDLRRQFFPSVYHTLSKNQPCWNQIFWYYSPHDMFHAGLIYSWFIDALLYREHAGVQPCLGETRVTYKEPCQDEFCISLHMTQSLAWRSWMKKDQDVKKVLDILGWPWLYYSGVDLDDHC